MILSNVKILRLGIANRNGRIYTEENVREVVRDFNDKIRRLGVVYGEQGHPESNDTSLSKVSHVIRSLRVQRDFVLATIEVLATKCGKEIRKNPDDYVFRTRGIGQVSDKGIVDLQVLQTVDAILLEDDSYAGLMDENYGDDE
ncbi:MAG: prohead core scaffold protein [uncultured marine phage]|uniref:Prohead core scaffold protein n=1 Tax=uncultured marine phage TaxID=707152 RepID=A0A8D9CBS6_9VIRU|nr:MAG: prohead core scaffold protein [uncultured marine phage]